VSQQRGRRGLPPPPEGPPPQSPLEPQGERLRRWGAQIAREAERLGRAAGRAITAFGGSAWARLRGLAESLRGGRTARGERPREAATRRLGSADGRAGIASARGSPARAVVMVARRDDDLAALIGRIDTAPDIDLVLVVPRQARALREATVWAHVSAHVRRRGIALGVVSPRGDVRAHARANGLRGRIGLLWTRWRAASTKGRRSPPRGCPSSWDRPRSGTA